MENILNLLEEKATIINEKFNNETLNDDQAEIVKLLLDAIEVFRKEQTAFCLFPKSKMNSLGTIDEEALHDVLNKHCQKILQEIAIKKLGLEVKSKVVLFKCRLLMHHYLKQTIKILFSSDLDKVNTLDLPIFKEFLLKSEV